MAAAMEHLGLDSSENLDIEVMKEPVRGFLGRVSEKGLYRVTQRSDAPRRRSKRGNGSPSRGAAKGAAVGQNSGGAKGPGGGTGGGNSPGGDRPKPSAGSRGRDQRSQKRPDRPPRQERPKEDDDRSEMTIEDQAKEIGRFLEGLLAAFGLDGEVETRIDDGVIYADVVGEQTEALVGTKGATMQATLELCRTIIQRRVQAGAKIRLDIAGYNERRREALRIYAGRLASKVLEDGGEVMLEPMNSAERKVVHDAIGEIDGVRSYSEGEEPRRSVVVAKEDDS
jgi:spoIIIJ-associated protein